jgi:flagellin-like hook-associated protein FlgL
MTDIAPAPPRAPSTVGAPAGSGAAPSAAARRGQSTRWATAAQVAGIVGIVICVLLIVVAWLFHGAARQTVSDLGATVDTGIASAITATDTVASRLQGAGTEAGLIAAEANAEASNPSRSSDAIAALTARVGNLADGYRAIRERYAEARANLTSALSSLQRVARLVPGASAPSDPPPALAELDARLQAVDDTVTSVWSSLNDGGSQSAVAATVATGVGNLQGLIDDAAARVRDVQGQLGGVQANAASAANGIGTIITLGSLAITLLFLWVLGLNVALWQLGRHWKRESMASSTGGESPGATAPPMPVEAPTAV